MIGILTEDLGLQAHLHKIDDAENSVFGAGKEDDEALEHYLCHCPAFASKWKEFLGNDAYQTWLNTWIKNGKHLKTLSLARSTSDNLSEPVDEL